MTSIISSQLYRDHDNDGFWAFEDAFDDDATEYLDTDNDGIGNNADEDDDNDGLTDQQEDQYGLDSLNQNDAFADFDADGILNIDEIAQGTDINDAADFVLTLNQEFNNGEIAYYNLTDGSNEDLEIYSAIHDGSQLLLSGYYYDESLDDDYGVISRINSDGQLDIEFGELGVYYGSNDDLGSYFDRVTKMANGGYLTSISYYGHNSVLASISATGMFDSSVFADESTPGVFSTAGGRSNGPVIYQNAAGELYLSSSTTEANGKIIIQKLSSDYVKDTSFASSGEFTIDNSSDNGREIVKHIFEQANGNVLIAFTAVNHLRFVELTPQGEINTDFGNDGWLAPTLVDNHYQDVIQLSDGRVAILFDGNVNGSNGLHVTTYSAQGVIDTSFGDNGYFNFSHQQLTFNAIKLFEQANQTLLIASNFKVNGSNGAQLVQVTLEGELDKRFNNIGYSRVNISDDVDILFATKLDNHQIIFSGEDDQTDYLAFAFSMLNAYDNDLDGVTDSQDAFPNDPTETLDSDNDGVGDNADAFPNDPTETRDSDNDGVGDNADLSYQKLGTKIDDLNYLISDIYELALSDVNGLSFEPTKVDFIAVIKNWAEEFEHYACAKGFQWQLHINTAHALVNIDQDRIKQVLSNLLTNSIKYTAKPGLIALNIECSSNHVIIILKDSSPGVPEAELKKIFERLYRVEKSRNRRTGGSGLGLSISQNIIEAHRGTIVATKSDIGGLAVSITIPLSTN